MLTISELIYCKKLIEVTSGREVYTKKEIKHVKNFYHRLLKILRPYFLTTRAGASLVVVNALKTSILMNYSAKNIQRIVRGFLIRKKSKIETQNSIISE